jgi:hypothetical protein
MSTTAVQKLISRALRRLGRRRDAESNCARHPCTSRVG